MADCVNRAILAKKSCCPTYKDIGRELSNLSSPKPTLPSPMKCKELDGCYEGQAQAAALLKTGGRYGSIHNVKETLYERDRGDGATQGVFVFQVHPPPLKTHKCTPLYEGPKP